MLGPLGGRQPLARPYLLLGEHGVGVFRPAGGVGFGGVYGVRDFPQPLGTWIFSVIRRGEGERHRVHDGADADDVRFHAFLSDQTG